MNPYWDPAASGIVLGWTGAARAANIFTVPFRKELPTDSGWSGMQ
jgi:hypothetical protein